MQPRRLPNLILVPGISGVSIAPAGSTTVSFQWLSPRFIEGLKLFPRSASRVDMAGLRLRIVDETSQDVILEGSPFLAANSAPALVLQGPSFSVLPLQRPVADGDAWQITVTNGNAGAVIPNLVFYLGEAHEHAA